MTAGDLLEVAGHGCEVEVLVRGQPDEIGVDRVREAIVSAAAAGCFGNHAVGH